MPLKSLRHFEISERKIFLRIFDVVWVLVSLYLVGILFHFEYFSINSNFWEWGIVLGLYLSVFSSVFELYDLQKASKFDVVLKNVILTTSVTVLFFLLTPFFTPVLPSNRLQIIYFYLAIISALLLWRYSYITLISAPRFYKRVLIIGEIANIETVAEQLQQSDPNYNIIGFMNTGQGYSPPGEIYNSCLIRFDDENLKNILKLHQITEILVLNSGAQNNFSPVYLDLLELLKKGFSVKDYDQVYEEKTKRIPVQHMEKDFYNFFPFSRHHQNKFYLFSARLFDIFISILGLIIGLFLIPIIKIGNYFGNSGKLFYYQDRVGKNGKIFKIIKFRSMKCDAEINGAQWAQKNDIRVTKFGRFLRRSRLDEFPQFYNILKGDMSLIGPRPERPVFVEELSKTIHFYDTRHLIKPGLTGWAQVMNHYGCSHTDSMEKLQYDLYYLKHRNIFLDFTILIKTLSTIVFYRGQ